jgi:prevent-host-death family protein
MKTMSAMEMRRRFGAILDEVRIKSEPIIVERAGRPIAMITPIKQHVPQDDLSRPLQAIRNLTGAASLSERGKDVTEWMDSQREDREYEDLR